MVGQAVLLPRSAPAQSIGRSFLLPAAVWSRSLAAWSASSLAGGSLICGSGIATVKSFVPPQGRLTLQSGTPVMNTTQAAKATLYYDCFHGGNSVPYYTGSADTVDTIGSHAKFPLPWRPRAPGCSTMPVCSTFGGKATPITTSVYRYQRIRRRLGFRYWRQQYGTRNRLSH